MRNKKIIIAAIGILAAVVVSLFIYKYMFSAAASPIKDGILSFASALKDAFGLNADTSMLAEIDRADANAASSSVQGPHGGEFGAERATPTAKTPVRKSAIRNAADAVTEKSSPDQILPAPEAVATQASLPPPVSPRQVRACAFPRSPLPAPSRKIVLNEIAWMGSPAGPGESAADAGRKEWVELKNISGSAVDLFGWSVIDASEDVNVAFDEHATMESGTLFVLARASGANGSALMDQPSLQRTFSGNIPNGGDHLVLLDPDCVLSDEVDASARWPGGDNETKRTLERDADGSSWHTSAAPGGTPGAENSVPPPPTFDLIVAFAGDNAGTITSTPTGLQCGAQCRGTFAEGTLVTLRAFPGTGTTFAGWSDPCFGSAACAIVMNGRKFVTATFRATAAALVVPPPAPPVAISLPSTDSDAADAAVTSTPAASSKHLMIAAISTGGASSTNDLVKIYNPSAASVDIKGWRLRKRSKTGTESSLREFPEGSTVAPGAYVIWANSAGGFSETVGAAVSSTETISADNSVGLFDAGGTRIDAVAWGAGVGQFVEGSAFPTDPAPGETLARKMAGGTLVDSDNNAADFAL